jgi:hypothetical protein
MASDRLAKTFFLPCEICPLLGLEIRQNLAALHIHWHRPMLMRYPPLTVDLFVSNGLAHPRAVFLTFGSRARQIDEGA